MPRTALIVGGGLGGLATAVRLRLAGFDVTVLEKNDRVGGRCNVWQAEGFTFDTGPTLLLMRDVLDDLFSSAGRTTDGYLTLERLFPNYRVQFAGGDSITLSTDTAAVAEQLERIEPGAGPALFRYLSDAGYKYRISRARFVERNFVHAGQFATLPNLGHLLTTTTLRKLDVHAGRYFRDPNIIAALTFQTMYLGLSPSAAPSVYSLLPYTEMREGIWYPRGGMYQVVVALTRLACELGVRIETGTEVTALVPRGRRIQGVSTADGRTMTADVCVCNADLPYSYETLVPLGRRGSFTSRRLRRLDYGSSAYLLYLGLDRRIPQANHHDVYLSADTAANYDDIFRRHTVPADPSFYVCTPSRTDNSVAPPGKEAMYVLVPAPRASASIDWSVEGPKITSKVFDRLRPHLGDIQSHVSIARVYTPNDFVADYNLKCGSAFGLSHRFGQVGYFRPNNKARDLDNLYFVGASTVPGGGVPMVVIGARLVTERIIGDWGHA